MVQKATGLRDDQVYVNIQRYGNTTAASIPIALDEALTDKAPRPRRTARADGFRLRVHVGDAPRFAGSL